MTDREIIGKCVCCEATLRAGDMAYRYDDDIIACAACAPTWGEARAEAAEHLEIYEGGDDLDEDDIASLRAFVQRCDERLAGGGDPADKYTNPL
ncbi:hypothetical protein ACM64Y_00425 [Novispirillum sp. DQ9]|uniref:hypothetical protein n=1 Tax=Novispirillum sp. DQ9 TaxID=3398612 RepID=UPI003C7E25E3